VRPSAHDHLGQLLPERQLLEQVPGRDQGDYSLYAPIAYAIQSSAVNLHVFLFKPVRWVFSGGEAKTCTQVG